MNRESLEKKHWTRIREIGESFGIPYSNKQEVIDLILQKREDQVDEVDCIVCDDDYVEVQFVKNHLLGRRRQVKEISREDYLRLKALKIVK